MGESLNIQCGLWNSFSLKQQVVGWGSLSSSLFKSWSQHRASTRCLRFDESLDP